MAEQYSWLDASGKGYSAGQYGGEAGKLMKWSRNTVADGKWLNKETIEPFSGRDQYLLDSLNQTYDECSAFSGDLQGQIDVIEARSDVVDVVGTYADFSAKYIEHFDPSMITDKDVVKILKDEEENNAQTYYRWLSAYNAWEYVGQVEPHYYIATFTTNTLEVKNTADDRNYKVITDVDRYIQLTADGNTGHIGLTDDFINSASQVYNALSSISGINEGSISGPSVNHTVSNYSLAQGSANSASYDSFAQGRKNYAKNQSVAQGNRVSAENYSIGIGKDIKVTNNSLAIGYHSYYVDGKILNVDDCSVSIGKNASASDRTCLIGENNSCKDRLSFAQGSTNYVREESFAQGVSNSADYRSLAQGYSAYAYTDSLAQGGLVTAKNNSLAQGDACVAENESLAQGSEVSASKYSIAQGYKTSAYFDSFAAGSASTATIASFAQGFKNYTYSLSFAQGQDNTGKYTSLTQGWQNSASDCSIAQGYDNRANNNSITQGSENTADNHSVAQGFRANATDYSIAQGYTVNSEDHSFAQGTNNTAEYTAFAQGSTNTASMDAFSHGISNTATQEAFTQGSGNNAEINSFAQGKANNAAHTAFAQGLENTAIGYSFAQGYKNDANSVNEPLGMSFAQGYANTADVISFAQGRGNHADNRSFAQGSANTAIEIGFAHGVGNHADGGFANGTGNTALGTGSLAIGINNYAGNYSQALGRGVKINGFTTAPLRGGMAIGTFNKTSANVAFVIGNGTNESNRSDLYWIDYDGNVSAKGNVSATNFYINGNSIDSIVSAKFSAYNGSNTLLTAYPISSFGLYANTAKYITISTANNNRLDFSVADTLINSASSGYQAKQWINTNGDGIIGSAKSGAAASAWIVSNGTTFMPKSQTFDAKGNPNNFNTTFSYTGFTLSAGSAIGFNKNGNTLTISAEAGIPDGALTYVYRTGQAPTTANISALQINDYYQYGNPGDDNRYLEVTDINGNSNKFALWHEPKLIQDRSESQIPIFSGNGTKFTKTYIKLSELAKGNYVSAGNNQKLTMISADSLTLGSMQPGIIYLV